VTGKILGCKKGFTILELTLVIAIIAFIMLPISMLLTQLLRSNVYSALDVKGRYAMDVIMQDIEQRIRRADNGSINIDLGAKKLQFTYMDADKDGNKKVKTYCVYQLDSTNKLFKRGIGTAANPTLSTFPVGLENGVITDFSATVSTSTPYTATITITSSTGLTLTKTIYLLNYNQ
jgi:prepilin-type N-terminal cleavage/methylation domain-containing protein